MRTIFLSIATTLVLHAQIFEVASVKSSDDKMGRPSPRDPGLYSTTSAPLQFLLMQAFDVKDYQLSGPAWIANEKFDIRAKIPEGAPREQVPVMLRNLIVERFGLKFHNETREISGYELVVAKGGLKMQDAGEPTGPPAAPESPSPGKPPVMATTRDKDGQVQLPPGRKGALRVGINGHARITARLQTAEDIVRMCTNQTRRPVVDKTGLSGNYDFNLDFSNGQSAAQPGTAPGTPLSELREDAPPFIVAIESLGLKLVAVKLPVDVVVIDHIDKVPAEN